MTQAELQTRTARLIHQDAVRNAECATYESEWDGDYIRIYRQEDVGIDCEPREGNED